MSLKLSTKISLVVLGIAVMAIIDSAAVVYSVTRIKGFMDAAIDENLSTIRAADRLQVAVLRQSALVRNFVLDSGNPEWVGRIAVAHQEFDKWLAEARRTPLSPGELHILQELDAAYHLYQQKQDETIARFKSGNASQAEEHAVNLTPLSLKVRALCEELATANRRLAEAKMEQARKSRNWATSVVLLAASSTVVLVVALVALFFHQVLRPLRRMLEELRLFRSDARLAAAGGEDEMRLVGRYLHALMTDAVASRSAAQMEHAEKLAAVGKLAARVAHEIRGPLNAMQRRLDALQHAPPGPDRLPGLAEMAGEVEQFDRIVRRFLEFSRPPLLRLRPQPFCPILAKAVEAIRTNLPEHGLEIFFECNNRLPFVSADAVQLERVFLNLLANAVDAIREQGRICVDAQVEADRSGREMIVVRIADNGPGIPREARERIFEPFFTTKPEGTGLGLCIAAQIVAGHAGSLQLESTLPARTTFAVWLPVAKQWFS